MDRRIFLAILGGAAAASASPVLAFQAERNEEGNEEAFYLALPMAVMRMFQRGADFSNRRNVRQFVARLQSPLNSMLFTKLQIASHLRGASCSSPTAVSAGARAAADQLLLDQRALRASIDRLALAVRPIGMEAAMTALSRQLGSLYTGKTWLGRVPGYCRLTPADRQRLLGEIDTSVRHVETARDALDRLMRGLGGRA